MIFNFFSFLVVKTKKFPSFLRRGPGHPKLLPVPEPSAAISVNARRRYMEDHLASIFMMYILVMTNLIDVFSAVAVGFCTLVETLVFFSVS